MQAAAQPYVKIAEAFARHDGDALRRLGAEHLELLQRDKNHGLYLQCVRRFTRARIRRLTHTYLTRSLADIAREVGLGAGDGDGQGWRAAEREVLAMVREGQVFATVAHDADGAGGMVSLGAGAGISVVRDAEANAAAGSLGA